MWKFVSVACLALALGTPVAAEVTPGKVSLTNEASRPVYCAVIIDGKTRNYINIRPGKTYVAELDTDRRAVQLVCERAKKTAYGPLKVETPYRLVDSERRYVDLVEGPAAAP